MNNLKRSITPWTQIATVHPFGKMPYAPGTWGSLVGIVAAFILDWAFGFHGLLGMLLFTILGIVTYVSIRETEQLWNCHDDKSIVIDEVLGQAIALGFCDLNWVTIFLGFGLFRLFDIWKPGIIGWFDREFHGAMGTLMDDVFAGLAAALCLGVIGWFRATS